jgi:hypothetical protein
MPDSITVKFSLDMVQQYLRPPGDSSLLQPLIDNALEQMEELARLERTLKTVIIEIDPNQA